MKQGVKQMRLAAIFLTAAALAWPLAAAASENETPTNTVDLSDLSIEELARVTVRSASLRDEPLSQAPTALFVILGDELEATAAMTIPEALRLAPNLQVQQVDARQYAITARGFNSIETSNKLLALLDGRTIYSPLASTVFWELHNRPIEDIRQIEVISGPGGTLYGPNAVNGVVSIMTRDASETLGLMTRATAGPEERTLALRLGTAIGVTGAIRLYATGFDREALPTGAGPAVDDRFRGWQAGFRSDFALGRDHLTVQGDIFDTDSEVNPGDGDNGRNLLARWSRDLGAGSSLQLQAYYDFFEREFLLVRDSLETFDVSAQLNRDAGAHDIVVGGGLRTTRDEFINNLNMFQLDPESRRLWVYNLFAQDRIAISPQLSLILGLKAEQTSFTGVELLPNVRLAWQPDPDMLLWGSVSRAVRTPSRIDRQLTALPLLAPATGFDSEKLIAFEAGYRGQPTRTTTLSVSFFYNLYDEIRTTELSPGGVLPIRLANGLSGHSYGLEAWSTTQATPRLRINLGVATLWKDFEMAAGRTDLAAGDSLGHDPNYQLLGRGTFAFSDRLRLNAGLRWVGALSGSPGIDDYAEADARLGFDLNDHVELFVAGRNLLHARHAESDDPQRAQLPQRSLFAGARLRF
jgi:iron complex outermembrane receptor protein